jgi:2-methylcitrate dehydratase
MTDRITQRFARFARDASLDLTPATSRHAKRTLLDSLGVALGALRHPAALAGRQYIYQFAGTGQCRVWGTGVSTTPEAATLVNGLLLRAYDYNDLQFGKANGGHPSDMLAGIIAVGEYLESSGPAVLGAIALSYEACFAALDTFALGKAGWDYSNLTAIGAVCGIGRLMGLSCEQLAHALAITIVPHAASNQIESNDLDASGELTMWKRLNGADGIRQAVYACALASCGVEGAQRPFEGTFGLIKLLQAGGAARPEGLDGLDPGRPLGRMSETTMKMWPVGSRAQSGVQAALAARAQVKSVHNIKAVRVQTDEDAYHHLVRAEAWHPTSRTQADHSLPYIIATVVADGHIDSDSFAAHRLQDSPRLAMLANTTVEPAKFAKVPSQAFPTRVEIELIDGQVVSSEVLVPSGHASNPLSDQQIEDKYRALAEPVLGNTRAGQLADAVWNLELYDSVGEVTRLLVA